MWMMVAFVLGEVAAYQMGMTVWFIIAAAFFLFHRKLRPMKQKTLHEDAPGHILFYKNRVGKPSVRRFLETCKSKMKV